MKSKVEFSKRVNIVSVKLVKEKSISYTNRKIGSPYDAHILCKDFLENEDREKLIVVCLDTKNQPTSINIASIGTINSSLVHPREIFKTAILSNSNSILVAHNHPSGNPTPSEEDINITNRLQEVGEIIGIKLIDHIIIGEDDNFISLKENSYI